MNTPSKTHQFYSVESSKTVTRVAALLNTEKDRKGVSGTEKDFNFRITPSQF